ncbi:MAG TPA: hypothetical protein V6C63_21550 [Allocoleopsis sp.]
MSIANTILASSEDTSHALPPFILEEGSFTRSVFELQENFAVSADVQVSTGANLINGTPGDDQLIGSVNNDELFGGAGDDQLVGGAGDDILSGGSGNDILSGGEGRDVFILALGEGIDTIIDFVEGVDSIQFAGDLTSRDIITTQQGNSTFIRVAATNELLAVLTAAPALQVIETPDFSAIVI